MASAHQGTNLKLTYIRYYASYLDFFTKQVAENGVGNTIETYVFSPEANGNEGKMAMRLVGGAYVHLQDPMWIIA